MARFVPTGAPFPVAIAARHVRLCAAHVEALFGPRSALRSLAPLTQPGEVACMETVSVRGPDGRLDDVRVVGPVVERTRVELSPRDLGRLGIPRGARPSARLEGSPGCTLVGPRGMVVLAEGVLGTSSQLLASVAEAGELGLAEGSTVTVSISGDRARVLSDVLVRVHPDARLEVRVDLDDAASLDLTPETVAYLVKEAPVGQPDPT